MKKGLNDTETIKIQNLTKFYTLVLLKSNEEVTGYYILKRLAEDLNKTASPTYIYDFLKRLKKEGYVKDIINPKSKRKKGYRLTSLGNSFINKIFLRFNNLIDVAIQSKLKICASCGVKLYENYHSEIFHDKEMNFCCIHCAKAYKNSTHSH
ncbi:MAG: PadR family transcriptional regulator [Candidatus Lokiarchaeota archaeon]|nr:PadR family transcriptional regulator [Candidatus Lokiarchaeota archaeon]